MTAGIDQNTGRILEGWDHVQQSLGVIFTTSYGERIMREWFGSFVPRLLGENLIERTLLRFAQAVIIAVELFEPRFRVRRARFDGTPESLRAGRMTLVLLGDYRPRALVGDFTVEGPREYRMPLNPL